MTANQVAYWNMRENVRHNQAQEGLKSKELELSKKKLSLDTGLGIANTILSPISKMLKFSI